MTPHPDQPGDHRGLDLQARAEQLGRQTFLGVPTPDFRDGGREHFIYLLAAGLNPYCKVVDLGCGVLRLGYWLIHFLAPSHYCGIEPHKGRLAMGLETILEPGILGSQKPRFDHNADFDTSVFGEKFDVFLAYSIWTHACKRQICQTLDSFLRDSTEQATFLTTYLPAGEGCPDYQGDQWFGTSHESDVPGCIYHDLTWIKSECTARGLSVTELGQDRYHGQSWLAVNRAGNGGRPAVAFLNDEQPRWPAGPRWPWHDRSG